MDESRLARRGGIGMGRMECGTLEEACASSSRTVDGLQLTYEQTLGPHHWLLRSPTPSFSLPYPDLSILYHPTFLSSLFSWTLFTVLIPLIVALFLATPSDDDSERSSRKSRRKKVAPPQALQFALARIGCAVLWGYIFRRESRVKWDFYAVDGFPAIQVLGSVMSAAFAAVEN